ncbi:hypothetical protein ACHHYP_16216 [Achlya hypogyna]|uniref:Palmitoyltransferase n=1 Tax=Achlya hypogyna TaxID=1202772 RepID=A0A1V9Y9D8_ACHHY|nr:hypothetical protein ACHHYP_16216 [Achlya hypogyna]
MSSWQRLAWVMDLLEAALGPLLVTLGLFLTIGGLYSFTAEMLPRISVEDGPVLAALHGGIGCYLFLQMLVNHWQCIRTSPGDASLMPTIYEDEMACDYCNAPQPPRCTHCHTCQTCVLELDHHCVWMNNCIGAHNYRYFWLYLFFGWINCAHVAWVADGAMARIPRELSFEEKVLLQFPCVICVGLALALFSLWLVHVYLLLVGQTTLDLLRSEPLRKALTWTCMRRNVERVFGTQWWRTILVPSFEQRLEKRHRKPSHHLIAL